MSFPDLTGAAFGQPGSLDFAALMAGVPPLHEGAWRRKDGQMVPVEISAAEQSDGNIQAIVRDISRRRHIEAALRESQERLRLVVDSAPIVILAMDRQGQFTLATGAGLARTRRQSADIVGQSAYDLYQDLQILEYDGRKSSVADALGRVFAGETLMGLTDFNGVVFNNTLSPLRDAEAQITGLVGVLVDMTGQKRAEEALQASERFARATVDALSAHLAILDERGTILAVNRAWRDFAEANSAPGSAPLVHEGVNYLDVCDAAQGPELGRSAGGGGRHPHGDEWRAAGV